MPTLRIYHYRIMPPFSIVGKKVIRPVWAKGGDEFAIATIEFAITYHKAVVRWLESAPGQ